MGCIEIKVDQSILIGIQNTTSSLNQFSSAQILAGASRALQTQPMVFGHIIQLIIEETTCQPSQINKSISGMTTNHNIVAVLGPSCTYGLTSFMREVSQSGKAILVPTFQSDKVVLNGVANIAPSITQVSENLAKLYQEKLPILDLAVLIETPLLDWEPAIKKAFDQQGKKVNILIVDSLSSEIPVLLGQGYTPSSILLIVNDPDLLDVKSLSFDNQTEDWVLFSPYLLTKSQSFLSPGTSWFKLVRIDSSSNPLSADSYSNSPIFWYSHDSMVILFHAIKLASIQLPNGELLIPRNGLIDAMNQLRWSKNDGSYLCLGQLDCSNGDLEFFNTELQPH